MPVLPSEDTAPSNLTEKLAKDPSSQTESTASEAEGHANEHNPLGKFLPCPPPSPPPTYPSHFICIVSFHILYLIPHSPFGRVYYKNGV